MHYASSNLQMSYHLHTHSARSHFHGVGRSGPRRLRGYRSGRQDSALP